MGKKNSTRKPQPPLAACGYSPRRARRRSIDAPLVAREGSSFAPWSILRSRRGRGAIKSATRRQVVADRDGVVRHRRGDRLRQLRSIRRPFLRMMERRRIFRSICGLGAHKGLPAAPRETARQRLSIVATFTLTPGAGVAFLAGAFDFAGRAGRRASGRACPAPARARCGRG